MTLAFSKYVAYEEKLFHKIYSFCMWPEVLSELIDLGPVYMEVGDPR